MIKQQYSHFKHWEDFKNGFFSILSEDELTPYIEKSKYLLADPVKCLESMRNVVFSWKVSAKINLTNSNVNRRAWVGQAACCYTCKSPSEATRKAWWLLSDKEQQIANQIADQVIAEWENWYTGRNRQLKLFQDA